MDRITDRIKDRITDRIKDRVTDWITDQITDQIKEKHSKFKILLSKLHWRLSTVTNRMFYMHLIQVA